ncbi:hypothetical protein [Catelliglobosispora koreensis]|uniref:hypothetical protein n=1 Tax=Catelliglobosispora koreensis TaxID=129052 RepID=UPI0003693FA0|nr:hypothetical protein [Catelliglobosispora koreensis]
MQACPAFSTSTQVGDDHEARRTFTILATNFAGKSSVLFRQKTAVHEKASGKHVPAYDQYTTAALIQQGDHVIQVYIEKDAANLAKQLSAKAVARLCAAITC